MAETLARAPTLVTGQPNEGVSYELDAIAAVVIAAVMWMSLGSRVSFNVLWGASMALAVVMPMLFYPFSRTLWLAFDLHFRPNEQGDR